MEKKYTIEEIKEFVKAQSIEDYCPLPEDYCHIVWVSNITHENIAKANDIKDKDQLIIDLD